MCYKKTGFDATGYERSESQSMKIMRKIFGPLLFLTAFALGCGLTLAFSLITFPESCDVEVVKEVSITVSACDLLRKNDYLEENTITFPSTVYAISSGELIANALNGEGCQWPGVHGYLPAEINVLYNTETEHLRDYLQKNRLEVDLQITGTVKSYCIDGKYQEYLINPTKLKRLSPFRPFTPKGAA